MKSKRVKYVLVLAAAATALGLWWGLGRAPSAENPGPATTQVVRRTLSSAVLATGAVKPQVGAEVRVGARISGKVERLFANIGDVVKKGQVIAEIEKADLQAQVDQKAAELKLGEAKLAAVESLRPREIEMAQAEVTSCQATLELNRKALEREGDLLKSRITSQETFDQARERLSVSEAKSAVAQMGLELARATYDEDLKQAAADVERAEAALADARVQLSYATITAPIEGVVGLVSTQEGETVAAGLNAPTFVTIVDLTRLQVDTFVDEVDIGKVQPGQKAIFTVEAFPAREFEGKAVAIYPKAVIQENVVNYDVVVQITDKYEGLLRPEMTASVRIFLEAKANVLAVPVKALKREQGKSVVYVLANSQPQAKEVKGRPPPRHP